MNLPPIKWPEDGLVPVVIQDDDSDVVLMIGFMNAEALQATQTVGQVHFWSRSRQELWHKGSGSGHLQHVRSIAINCEENSLLIRVKQDGAVCHDGYATCYYRDVLDDGTLAINQDRLFDPRDVYGDGFGLAGITREWWGAYEWLRDHDLSLKSGTSAVLRDSRASSLTRIQDELGELAGVLDGSHVHNNPVDDAVLEASQCCYWIAVEAIRAGVTWDDARPDRAFDVPTASIDSEIASAMLRAEATVLTSVSPGVVSHLFQVIAESVRALELDPRSIIEHDLAELRTRAYLSEYFAR